MRHLQRLKKIRHSYNHPYRLPASYVKWIDNLARVDPRLLDAVRIIREGKWSYAHGSPSHAHILSDMSRDLGHPAVWGDPAHLPPYGGPSADAIWKQLGVTNRSGVGGFPCEIVHNGLGASWGLGNGCTTNAGIRLALAWVQALAIYLPVRLAFSLESFHSDLINSSRCTFSLLYSLGQSPCCALTVSSCQLSSLPSAVPYSYRRSRHSPGMVCASHARFC